MHRKLVLSVALFATLALLSQVPAFAGAVYVPIEKYHTDDQTIIWVTNPGGLQASFSTYHIPGAVDGTVRPNDPVTTAIAPGKTVMLREIRNKGLLEIYSESELQVTARFIRSGDFLHSTLGESVPVIDSDRSARPGDTMHLEGLQRGPGGQPRTDLRIVNLGHAPTTCSVRFNALDGLAVGPVFVLSNLIPLTNLMYTDVLGIVEHFNASGARVQVSCDQAFYTYSVVRNSQPNRAVFTMPRPSTSSALSPPGLALPCSIGSTCYEVAGVFHTPTPGNRVKRLVFPVAPGTYNRVRMRMEVKVGPWNTPTSGLHNVLWLAVERNFDLVSYINFRGPNNNDVLFRHGIGQEQSSKARITVPATFNQGQTYVIDYLYDTNVNLIELLITNSLGQEVARILHTPNVNRLTVDPGERFLADFGFLGINPNEPPTFGWDYQNLSIEITP